MVVASGAPADKLVVTNSVVASLVELSPADCVTAIVPVGKLGVPIKLGEAKVAFKSNAVWVAVLIGFNKSVVLSTLLKPTIDLEIPPTVPVKVGEAKGAFKANDEFTSDVFAFRAKEDVTSAEFAFKAKELFTSAVFAFRESPGTVGAIAVPPKSPAN